MYHSILQDTRYLDGKQIIIDLAERDAAFDSELLDALYPHYELMAMHLDGEEIERMETNDRAEAERWYHLMLSRYSTSPLKGKYAKLRDDLRIALAAAKAADTGEDGGTCNHDSPSIRLPRWIESKVEDAAREAGTNCFKWELYGGARYVFDPMSSGQANKRSRASEAMCESLKAAGYDVFEYCAMD